MFLCKIFEQVEKKSSEHVDFVYGCGKQGTVMHKEVEKAIQCHREIEKEKKKWICDTFDAYCTEMEGAAIAQAAWLNQIPFVIIRAISDKADGSAHMDYSEFEAKAIEHTVRLVEAAAAKLA